MEAGYYTLGLDLGSNSLGWACVSEAREEIIDAGAAIYRAPLLEKERVPRNVERRNKRQQSRQTSRRRFRRDTVMKYLIRHGMFPYLRRLDDSDAREEILSLALQNIPVPQKFESRYPLDSRVIKDPNKLNVGIAKRMMFTGFAGVPQLPEPLQTFGNELRDFLALNPYKLRSEGLHRKLSLIELGRILYQIAIRRGFKSNAKDQTENEDNETSKLKQRMSELEQEVSQGDSQTLGAFLYKCEPFLGRNQGTGIRNRPTTQRLYEQEFDLLWEYQANAWEEGTLEHDTLNYKTQPRKKNIRGEEVIQEIPLRAFYGAPKTGLLFYRNPLRSQKGLVGHCTLEPRKTRCPISHPEYEYFRSLQNINNLGHATEKIDTETGEVSETKLPLSFKEREKVLGLLNTKRDISYNQLLKTLGLKKDGNNLKGIAESAIDDPKQKVMVGNPTTRKLIELYGQSTWDSWNWEHVHKLWHCIQDYDDPEMRVNKLAEDFDLPSNGIDDARKIPLKDGYADLSLRAIRRITPWMEKGYMYSHAVFLAKLNDVFKDTRYPKEEDFDIDHVAQDIINVLTDKRENDGRPAYQRIRSYLFSQYALKKHHVDRLYHPSRIESTYKTEGNKLPSPDQQKLRNPIVKQALYMLRTIVNAIIEKHGMPTSVHIELAREVNSRNKKVAIENWQKRREEERKKIKEEIKQLKRNDQEPSEIEIDKLFLHKELQANSPNNVAQCPYTGKTINCTDLFGDSAKFDIEHIIPYSKGMDDSLANKTLCDIGFNRNVKGNKIPYELKEANINTKQYPNAKYEDIVSRVDGYKKEYLVLEKEMKKAINIARNASTTEDRNKALVRKEMIALDLRYYTMKHKKFLLKKISDVDNDGFINRQLNETSYMSRLAREYLASIFGNNVVPVKGRATSALQKVWNLERADGGKKDREKHLHHAEDAVIIALTSRTRIQKLAVMLKRAEDIEAVKKNFPRPWEGFSKDLHHALSKILVHHHQNDRLFSAHATKIKANGKEYKITKRSPRGALHDDTLYRPVIIDGQKQSSTRKPITAVSKNLKIPATISDGHKQYTKEDLQERGIPIKKVTVEKEGKKTRVPLSEITIADVPHIVGPPKSVIEQALEVEQHILDNTDKLPQNVLEKGLFMPVNNMRLHAGNKLFKVRDHDFSLPNSNYLTLVYSRNGTWNWQVYNFWEAILKSNNTAEFEYDLPRGAKFVFDFKKQDSFLLGLNDTEYLNNKYNYEFLQRYLYVVISISPSDHEFIHHLSAVKSKEQIHRIASIKRLRQLNPLKVNINELGEITLYYPEK